MTPTSSKPISEGSGATVLNIEGLHVSYGGLAALNGVSIAVGAGEFVSVVGPNGAGKTTLFKTISGVVRHSAGRIEFEGVRLRTDIAARAAEREAVGG